MSELSSSPVVTGIAELDKKLVALKSSVARKVSRAAVGAGQAVMTSAIRAEISAESGLSPQAKRAIKATVGRSFKVDKQTGAYTSKVGLGVGKRKAPKRSGKNKSGKGLSGLNVHWWALGTQPRRTKSGAYRGLIKPVRSVSRAHSLRGDWAQTKMMLKADQTLKAELEKLKV